MDENRELIAVDVRYQIEQYKDAVRCAVEYVKSLSIESKDEAEKSLDVACNAINLYERIEEARKSISEPGKKFQSEVNRLAKSFTSQLDEVKFGVIEKVDDWKRRNDDVRHLETSMVSTFDKIEFSYEISDPTMISRDYLTVDEDKVKLAMKQGVRAIPGLKIIENRTTSIRRK